MRTKKFLFPGLTTSYDFFQKPSNPNYAKPLPGKPQLLFFQTPIPEANYDFGETVGGEGLGYCIISTL